MNRKKRQRGMQSFLQESCGEPNSEVGKFLDKGLMPSSSEHGWRVIRFSESEIRNETVEKDEK